MGAMTAWDTVPNTVLTLFSAARYLALSIVQVLQQFNLHFSDVFDIPVNVFFGRHKYKPILNRKILVYKIVSAVM